MTSKALKLIESQNGKVITITFYKRGNGQLRRMNGRLGVTKHLKGGSLRYNAKEHNLITIFDLQSQGYRAIPLENIIKITAEGMDHYFKTERRKKCTNPSSRRSHARTIPVRR